MSDQSESPLSPCPMSPNCVSSLATDDVHKIEAFTLTRPVSDAWPEIKAIVLSLPRSKVVEEKPGYLHVEIRSLVFRFVDHLELAAEPASTRVDIRSASARGYSDLGVNRKRIEALRARLKKAGQLQ